MSGEADLAKAIEKHVRKAIFDGNGGDHALDIAREVDFIQNCTFVPKGEGYRLYLSHAETDVAVYTTAPSLSSEVQAGTHLKFWQTSDKEVRVPLVVVEVKRTPTTDAIRSRDVIAREMKQVFPFLGFFFIADDTSKSAANLWRHGKHFDGVFIQRKRFDSDGPGEDVIERLVTDGVHPHLEELANLDALPGP